MQTNQLIEPKSKSDELALSFFNRQSEIAYIDVELERDDNTALLGKINKSFKTRVIDDISQLRSQIDRGEQINAIVVHGHVGIPETEKFLSLIKSDSKLNLLPVIFITEQITDSLRRMLIEKGVVEVFNEDFSDEEFQLRTINLMKNAPNRVNISELNISSYKTPLSKRIFDICFSLGAIIALTPLFLVVMILIKLESRGPIFYISKRAGSGFKVFGFIKFRSMTVGADKQLKNMAHLNAYSDNESDEKKKDFEDKLKERAANDNSAKLYSDEGVLSELQYKNDKEASKKNTFIKIKNDSRVTRIGEFIRKTSIDELPQLFNVLKGDMSIVGNRPLPLYEAEKITTDEFLKRFLAPAGITGWWQTSKKGKDNMTVEERLKLDIAYARKYSFWRDIKIIRRTLPAMMQKDKV